MKVAYILYIIGAITCIVAFNLKEELFRETYLKIYFFGTGVTFSGVIYSTMKLIKLIK